MCSCPVRAGKALEGHGRPLRITLSRASDCTKYEIMLDVALHFDPGGHSCAEKLNKTNDRVGRETRQLFKLGHALLQRLRTPCGSPRRRRRVFRFANLSALPPCTHPRVARRRCHTARGLPPPVGLLGPTGVAARPAAIRGLLL